MLSKDLNKCLSIIYDSFTDDPYSWSKAVGFPFDKLKSWLKDYYLMNRVLCFNIPSIICSTDTGEIIGVCTIEDFNYPPYDNNPDNQAINEMTNKCESLLSTEIKDIRKHRVAYISFICVHKDFRRKNVGDTLIKTSTQMLKENGFNYITAYCTSYRSRLLFEKNGYKYIGGINYQNFCMPDNSKPYSSMPNDECSVMIIEL